MAHKDLEYNAVLVERRDHTSDLATFVVRPDVAIEDKTPFVGGQYVAIGLNNLENPALGSVRRSMSIVSAPEERGQLEFYIKFVKQPESDNPLTHLLWKMKVGDRIFMTRKPVGKFTLEDTIGADKNRYVLMVAAGTGLAPFVSMTRSMAMRDPACDMSKLILLHGASYPNELCYKDELDRYVARNKLHYIRSISRPKEAPNWTGMTGRVEDLLLPENLATIEKGLGLASGGLTAQNTVCLICGLQGTITLTITRLIPRGFVPDHRKIRTALGVPAERPSHIWWEQYDNTPVIDTENPELVATLSSQLAAAWA